MISTDIVAENRPGQQRSPQSPPQAVQAARRPLPPGEPKRMPAQPEARRAPQSPPKAWWFAFPAVMKACFKVATAPIHLAIMMAELIMAGLVLGVAGVIGAWWFGWITDEQILAAAKPVGDRLMVMIQSLGYL